MSILDLFILAFKTGFIIFFLLIAFLLLQFVVIPLYKLRYYKQQGFTYLFIPLMGSFGRDKSYEKKTKDIMGYYKELSQKDREVSMVLGNLMSRPEIILFDPKLIKEFYNNQSKYKKGMISKPLEALQGTGLFLAEGNTWKNHRKIISSIFHFDFLREQTPIIHSTTRSFLKQLGQTSQGNVSLLEEIQKITGETVGKIFFSENLNQYTVKGQPLSVYLVALSLKTALGFVSILAILLGVLGLNPEWVPAYKKFMDEIREFRQICLKIIQVRKNSGVKKQDLLGLLLETQNAPNHEDRFSDEDIVNEFITFFMAGMDTTAHVVTMAIYLLSKNPEYIEKIEREVKEIYSKSDSPSIEEINRMEILHGVIKESLRMYTPAPGVVPRIAQEDHNIGHIKVKKDTVVRTVPFYANFNSKYFEEPEVFKPERWFNKKEQELDPFVFVPFSAGPRNCIGQHLAMIEAKIIIAEFVRSFSFKVEPEEYDLVMTVKANYGPRDPIMMKLGSK